MTDLWTLPRCAVLDGKSWKIHSDYRDVLHLLRWLNGDADPALDAGERWLVALALFYPDFDVMSQESLAAAVKYLAWFLQAGRADPGPHSPRLMDWQQDAALIAAATARAAGRDLRTLPYLHWWSFLAWFDSIGDGGFATVVGIRDKLRRGRKLEPWEQEFYRDHRAEVDLRRPADPAADAEKQRLIDLLNAAERSEK